MKINKNIIARDIQGDTVLLNMITGDYFSLNPVGTDIYDCIVKEMDQSLILTFLLEKYNVDSEILTKDTVSLLSELRENNILED